MAVIGGAQALRAKDYETIYVLRPDVDADTAERVQSRLAEVIGREKGTLVKVEAWGRRKLAYPVQKQRKGIYVYLRYLGRGGLVSELERNLKLQDAVIKYQTVLLDDEVDANAITVSPEDITMERLELGPDEDANETREKLLGLIDPGPEMHRHREDREDREEAPAEEDAAEEPSSLGAKDDKVLN